MDQPTIETITVRTELPFEIKTEPDDDRESFYQSNYVKLTAQKEPNNTTETVNYTITMKSDDIIAENSTSSTKEPHRLEMQLTGMAAEVHALVADKEEAENQANELKLKYTMLVILC